MDPTVAATYPTPPTGLARASSLRATSGNRVYKLRLVDKVNSGQSSSSPAPSVSTTASTGSSINASATISAPAADAEPTPSQQLRERRRNRSFRLSLSIPTAPAPSSPVAEEPSSVGSYRSCCISDAFLLPEPDLFVSPKLPTVSKISTEPAIYEDSTDFLTLLATKQRRVLELREELSKAEVDLKELQQQWSAHEDRTRRSVQLQAVTGLPNGARKRLSFDSSRLGNNGRKTVSTGLASDPSITTSTDNRREGGTGFGRLLSPSFPFPSPPKTAPSGRPFAPRTSSLNDTASTPASVSTATSGAINYPGINEEFEYDFDNNNNVNIPIRADEVIHMGRKLAEGINNHLWNLFDDIKQAAIGEDLSAGPTAAKRVSVHAVGNSTQPLASLDWRRSRTTTGDSRESANDYVDETDRSPSPPVRHMSSFANSPIKSEPLGIDSPEYRGSPQSKLGSRQKQVGEYSGYNVLHETPAGFSSTSLIEFESSEDEIAPNNSQSRDAVQSRTSAGNKRISLYGGKF
ncbi:hypothetical protein V1520DRAFT_270440 [Lipomyces starkeyi]|uniref:DUF4048 domain-containing protein n=1 Tax=Lipomyces starkeyi NRRL Y-11557 TaxID=675824 RepID=A0A1E3Q2X4_LIPST|nr:hypothetical protein LIPSTDRAFT_4415 [Lipomyces starkeyi NRRL Y-11557]